MSELSGGHIKLDIYKRLHDLDPPNDDADVFSKSGAKLRSVEVFAKIGIDEEQCKKLSHEANAYNRLKVLQEKIIPKFIAYFEHHATDGTIDFGISLFHGLKFKKYEDPPRGSGHFL